MDDHTQTDRSRAHQGSNVDPYALLALWSRQLDGLERQRLDTANRLRALTHEPVEGERGGTFGLGFPVEHRTATPRPSPDSTTP